MKKTFKNKLHFFTAIILLFTFTSCNLATPEVNSGVLSTTVKTTVAKSIDTQMTYIKPQLEPDLQAKIDNNGKAGSPLNGTQIVELTLDEENGENYVDFCYEVTTFNSNQTADSVMNSARSLMSESEFNKLEQNVKAVEKSIQDLSNELSKGIRADQKEAFYKDMKSLVTRTVVMMTAGIVYAVIPETVLWGKISAAAAISIGAGLAANIVLSIYQKYKINDKSYANYTISQWLTELVQDPKADYALAAASFATASTITENAAVRGIVVCIFSLTEAFDVFQEMGKKYDFTL